MKFRFTDEAFWFEALRSTGFAAYSGQLGAVLASGHRGSARGTLLRAPNHHRTTTAGAHTHAGALARAHQTRFHGFATTLTAVR